MLFIDESLESSDEVARFIKLSVILEFCCYCLENLKASVVSINAKRLEENLLKLYPKLETTSRKKEVFISLKDDLMVALEYSRGHSLQNNAIHLSGGAHVLHGIKFLKNIRIPLVVSLIIVRMNQSQQRFLPLMHRITGSYDPNSKNKLKIRIFPHYHFCSSFILTQFFKEKIWEFHTISAMRHHLVFMSHFYCILRHEVVYS